MFVENLQQEETEKELTIFYTINPIFQLPSLKLKTTIIQ